MAIFVSIANNSAQVANDIGITGGAMSMAFWINGKSFSDTDTFCAQRDTGTQTGYTIRFSGSNVRFIRERVGVSDDSANYSFTPNTGQWYHFCLTYDGSNVRGYVDGILRAGPTASTGNGTAGASIDLIACGIHGDGTSNPPDAYFAHFVVYNKALSQNEVKNLMLQRPSWDQAAAGTFLQLYWPLQEGAGTTTYDHAPNGTSVNGAITSSVWSNLHPPTTYK